MADKPNDDKQKPSVPPPPDRPLLESEDRSRHIPYQKEGTRDRGEESKKKGSS